MAARIISDILVGILLLGPISAVVMFIELMLLDMLDIED